jgi:hypothetical protein
MRVVIVSMLFALVLVAAVSASIDASAHHGGGGTLRISNCTDPVSCADATCVVTEVPARTCVPLTANISGVLPSAKFATFECLREPRLCTPTQAFWQDPTCTSPMETLWTPCGTCLQDPPRAMECAVINGTFHSLVGTCPTATCARSSCPAPAGPGLTAGVCWPHPGVPGLYLKFATLEACAAVRVVGFDACNATAAPVAETILPAQGKCFKGLALECYP